MANILFNKFLAATASGDLDLNDAGTVVRVLLERSTSTYTPSRAHNFLSDMTGLVEVSVSSYGRQTLANKAVSQDDSNNRAEWGFDNIAFGTLESGQTVKAIVIYQQVGGDDSSPEDDVLIAYIDTASNGILPAVLQGGAFDISINAEGFLQLSQA